MDDIDLPEFFIAWVTFLQEFDHAFRDAPVEEASRPLATEQTRYVLAIGAVAKLLRQVGERDKASKFHPLAEALQDHVDGNRNPLLGIEMPTGKAGRRPDTSAVWRLRSNLCIGLEFMIAGGMEPETAISQIANQHHGKLEKLLRPGADLKSSIRTWRKSFANDEVTNGAALAIYKEDMKTLQHARAEHLGNEVRKAGEKLVITAAEQSARLPRIQLPN
jgi:hypothetical protein